LIVLAGAAVAVACSSGDPVPGADRRLSVTDVRRTPLLSSIAEEEVADVEWAADSTLMVAVNAGTEVLVVDWNGRIRRRASRRGSGPGETQGAMWVVRRSDGSMVTLDVLARRISWWTVDGTFLRDAPLDVPMVTGAWDSDRGLVVRTADGSRELAFRVINDSGKSTDAATFPARPASPDASCEFCAAAVSPAGVIAMAVSDTGYTILRSKLDGDSLSSVRRPDVAAVRRSSRERDSVAAVWKGVESRLADRGRLSPYLRDALRRSAASGEYHKRFLPRGILFDDHGWLWAQRSVADGDSATVDIFDERPAFVGTLRLAPGSVLWRVRQGRLLATQRGPREETVIREFAVSGGGVRDVRAGIVR
jgi:hypothetical protein